MRFRFLRYAVTFYFVVANNLPERVSLSVLNIIAVDKKLWCGFIRKVDNACYKRLKHCNNKGELKEVCDLDGEAGTRWFCVDCVVFVQFESRA